MVKSPKKAIRADNVFRELLEESFAILPEDEPQYEPEPPPEGRLTHRQRAHVMYSGFSGRADDAVRYGHTYTQRLAGGMNSCGCVWLCVCMGWTEAEKLKLLDDKIDLLKHKLAVDADLKGKTLHTTPHHISTASWHTRSPCVCACAGASHSLLYQQLLDQLEATKQAYLEKQHSQEARDRAAAARGAVCLQAGRQAGRTHTQLSVCDL